MFYDLAIKKDVVTCLFHLVEPLPEISRFDLMKSITLRRPFLKKYIEISNINVSRTKIILIFTLILLEKKLPLYNRYSFGMHLCHVKSQQPTLGTTVPQDPQKVNA